MLYHFVNPKLILFICLKCATNFIQLSKYLLFVIVLVSLSQLVECYVIKKQANVSSIFIFRIMCAIFNVLLDL